MLRGAQLITGSRVGTIIQAIVPNLPFFYPTHSLLALSPISGRDGDRQPDKGRLGVQIIQPFEAPQT